MGATVRDSESGVFVVQLGNYTLSRGCFSPDGRFVACSNFKTIYVWDITIPGARLVQTLVGHSESIIFLAFPSALVSGSLDQSVKFWQSSSFLTESTTTDHVAALPLRGSAPIMSVKLFAEESTLVTSDKSGVVKTWDLMTSTCKSSSSTPAKGLRDTHLEGDTLIIVWRTISENQWRYRVWDVYNRQFLQSLCAPTSIIGNPKISGDGSKIFTLSKDHVETVCMHTGEVRRVGLERKGASGLFAHGSKVVLNDSRGVGWDFAGPEVSEFGEFPGRPRLDLLDGHRGRRFKSHWIEDTVTKRPVFHFLDKNLKPDMMVEWDGRCLLIWSASGGAVVIDFDSVRRSLDRIR